MKFAFIFILLAAQLPAQGQEILFDLQKAGCTILNDNLVCYGIRESGNTLSLIVYGTGKDDRLKDSVIYDLGRSRAKDYLNLTSDTLHGYLNIYVQKSNENFCSVFRLTQGLEKKHEIHHVETGRLNNLQLFGQGPYYFADNVYSLLVLSDSGHPQYFLNKHQLKDISSNFEYIPAWQWSFGRKDLQWARIIHADNRYVYLFASRFTSGKNSQWLLKIDTETGGLSKARKLNAKDENATYYFSSCIPLRNQGIMLVGQKSIGKTGPECAMKEHVFYFAALDSSAWITHKTIMKMPVLKPKSSVLKCQGQFIQWNQTSSGESSARFEADLYQMIPGDCYFYNTTFTVNLKLNREEIVAENLKPGSITLETLYDLNDRSDQNGRICATGMRPEDVYTARSSLPVKMAFRADSLGNPMWLLKKNDTRKKNIQYSVYKPKNKIYNNQVIETIPHSLNSQVLKAGEKKFMISRHTPEGKLLIKVYYW